MDNKLLQVTVYIDGGARGNPGPAGAGVVIIDEQDGMVVYEAGLFLGRATNNVAEYQALLAGLKAASTLGAQEVTVRSDSELLVRQMNGQYRVKNAALKALFEQAGALVERFRRFDIEHVPRARNAHADRLVNQAIDLKRNVDGSQ